MPRLRDWGFASLRGMDQYQPVRDLSLDETGKFLSAHRFGRMAVVLAEEPQIFPVNYATHPGETPSGVIYIRSEPGDKLFAAVAGKRVAFEVDEVRADGATSVIAYGRGRLADSRQELDLVDTLGLVPWVATYKPDVIAIDLDRLSGREFAFGPQPDGTFMEPTA